MSSDQKKAETRLYEIAKTGAESILVEAATPAAALRIITERQYTVSVASAKRVLQLRDANCEVVMAKGGSE